MIVNVRFLTAAALVALVAAASPALAQMTQRDSADATAPASARTAFDAGAAALEVPTVGIQTDSTAAPRGPTAASARAGFSRTNRHEGFAPTPVLQQRSSNRNAVALMIVGGAALVIGAVIGDDAGTLVMLGGAGIGLYGLYLFLT